MGARARGVRNRDTVTFPYHMHMCSRQLVTRSAQITAHTGLGCYKSRVPRLSESPASAASCVGLRGREQPLSRVLSPRPPRRRRSPRIIIGYPSMDAQQFRFPSLAPRVERGLPWSLPRPFCLSPGFSFPVDPYRTGEFLLAVSVTPWQSLAAVLHTLCPLSFGF